MMKFNFVKKYRKYTTIHDLSLVKLLYLWFASFCMIGLLFLVDFFILDAYDASLLIAPFGASAVILYIVPQSAFARARALIGGHIVSAFIGISLYKLLVISGHLPLGLVAALAVSTSLVAMLITDTMHPPGAATAFSLIFADPLVHDMGYFFLIIPCFLGTSIMWLIAIAFHRAFILLNLYKNK